MAQGLGSASPICISNSKKVNEPPKGETNRRLSLGFSTALWHAQGNRLCIHIQTLLFLAVNLVQVASSTWASASSFMPQGSCLLHETL